VNRQTHVRMTVDVPADLAAAVTNAAAARATTADSVIAECIAQQFETALRHRVLIDRQNDIDEALLELARLIGRLSAGPGPALSDVCRCQPKNTE
jgi:hypothetical protein